MPSEWLRGSTRPLRRPGFSAVELDDNVALYDEAGQLLILLNRSAATVWELCDGTTTVDEMLQVLTDAHLGPPDEIADDVRQTIRKLVELGLVAGGADQPTDRPPD